MSLTITLYHIKLDFNIECEHICTCIQYVHMTICIYALQNLQRWCQWNRLQAYNNTTVTKHFVCMSESNPQTRPIYTTQNMLGHGHTIQHEDQSVYEFLLHTLCLAEFDAIHGRLCDDAGAMANRLRDARVGTHVCSWGLNVCTVRYPPNDTALRVQWLASRKSVNVKKPSAWSDSIFSVCCVFWAMGWLLVNW